MEDDAQPESRLLSKQGREAIVWNEFTVAHVCVTQVRLTLRSISVSVAVGEFNTARGRCWSQHCRWEDFYTEELVWAATGHAQWRLFFDSKTILDVLRIWRSFPKTDTFKTYDAHYYALIKPLHKALLMEACVQLENLITALDEIALRRQAPAVLRTMLENAAATLCSYRHARRHLALELSEFMQKVLAESEKSLSKDEADHLIHLGFHVLRALAHV